MIRSLARDFSSVIIVACFLAIVLHFANTHRTSNKVLVVGDHVPPELDMASARGLAIIISENSSYSRASVEFHERVIGVAHDIGLPITIAVDRVGSSSNALKAILGSADRLIRLRLDSLRIAGTPTILLIDSHEVVARWTGLLNASQEIGMLGRLNGLYHTLSQLSLNDSNKVEHLARFPPSKQDEALAGAFILDVRTREDYNTRPHLNGAINIPRDEVPIRTPVDLPLADDNPRIVIDCSTMNEVSCRLLSLGLSYSGFKNVWIYDLDAQGMTCRNTPVLR
jgi:rhodanese-related sulfurtransferase